MEIRGDRDRPARRRHRLDRPVRHVDQRPDRTGRLRRRHPSTGLFLRRHGLFGGVSGSGKSGGHEPSYSATSPHAPTPSCGASILKRGMELLPGNPALDRIATTPREAEPCSATPSPSSTHAPRRSPCRGCASGNPPQTHPRSSSSPTSTPNCPTKPRQHWHTPTRSPDVAAHPPFNSSSPPNAHHRRPWATAPSDPRWTSESGYRVRERRDVDLILGQGMHKVPAGTPTSSTPPGKFLISSPEHDIPRRARGYLLEDDTVQHAAQRSRRPTPCPRRGIAPGARQRPPPTSHANQLNRKSAHDADAALLAALTRRPRRGNGIWPICSTATGMSRATLYRRLAQLEDEGRARQTRRGRCGARPESHHNP